MTETMSCEDCELDRSCCEDCGQGHHDYYMVFDEVWATAGLPREVHCCLKCLQRRLGRALSIADFTVCAVNRAAFAAAGRLDEVLEHERRRDEEERRRRELNEVQWRQHDAQREAKRQQREWARTAQTKLPFTEEEDKGGFDWQSPVGRFLMSGIVKMTLGREPTEAELSAGIESAMRKSKHSAG